MSVNELELCSLERRGPTGQRSRELANKYWLDPRSHKIENTARVTALPCSVQDRELHLVRVLLSSVFWSLFFLGGHLPL